MDEDQKAVHKKDFKFKTFNFEAGNKEDAKRAEAECKAFKADIEATSGRRWSDVNHTDKAYFTAYSRIGEMTADALERSADFFNMRSPITGGFIVGRSWSDCH